MRWATVVVGLSCLTTATLAETLDLGKLDQYKPKNDGDAPKLDGDTLWFSNGGGGNMNVALSTTALDNAKAALEKCPKGKADNACYQNVHAALMNSNIEIDPKGERRRFVPLFVALIGVVAANMVMTWITYKEPKLQPVYFVPESKATDIPKMGQPLSITADGASTVVVVTPTPQAAPTKTKGSDVKITELPKPSDDAHLAFSIGDDLAKKLKQAINDNKECTSGKNYKRGSDILDMVGCASQAIVAASAPGGQFRELQFLGQDDHHLQINPDNQDLAGAARDLAQFVRDYSPMLGLTDPAVLDEFGLAIFLMVYESFIEPNIIQAVIPIKDKLIKMASSPTKTAAPSASASSSGCPDPDKKPLLCGWGSGSKLKNDCDVERPKDNKGGAKCRSGEYKGCPCNMPTAQWTQYEPSKLQQIRLSLGKGGGGGSDSKPTCSGNVMSKNSLASSFNSKDHKVYEQFCKKWSKKSKLEMSVNVYGSPDDGRPNVPPSDRTCGQYQYFQKPPYPHCPCQGSRPDMNCDISKYNLKYEPKDDKKDCDCGKAFEALGSCSRRNGDGADIMNEKGSIDSGCGTFSFDIYGVWPNQPEHKCYGLKDDKYSARSSIEDAAKKYCNEDAVKKGQLDKDSGSIQRTYYADTPDAVSISIDFKPGMDFKISYDDCMAKILGKCADDCDAPDPAKKSNPMNWKGGGEYKEYSDKGDVRYSVTPTSKRKPAPDSPQGHCHVDYKFGMLYNGVEIWGAGWESGDGGSGLKSQLKGCALFPAPGFKLVYEQTLSDKDKHGDGREWTAYFRTGIGQRKCTGHAIGSAGGFDWGCSGGGA